MARLSSRGIVLEAHILRPCNLANSYPGYFWKLDDSNLKTLIGDQRNVFCLFLTFSLRAILSLILLKRQELTSSGFSSHLLPKSKIFPLEIFFLLILPVTRMKKSASPNLIDDWRSPSSVFSLNSFKDLLSFCLFFSASSKVQDIFLWIFNNPQKELPLVLHNLRCQISVN